MKKKAKEEKEREKEYLREQTVRDTKAFALMTAKESQQEKARMEVGFIYDAPPNLASKKEEDDPLQLEEKRKLSMEEKFTFLKGAPREDHAKDLPARDKPFGIEVRNVRCVRCNGWGHQNTDRVCPMYGQYREADETVELEREAFEDPAVLMKQMKTAGFSLTQRVLGRANDPGAANQQLLPDEPEDEDLAFLASLSEADKRKLLKKMEKMEKKKGKKKKKRKSKHKSSRKRKASDDDDDDDDDNNSGSEGEAQEWTEVSTVQPTNATATTAAAAADPQPQSHTQSHRSRSPPPPQQSHSRRSRRSRSPPSSSTRKAHESSDRGRERSHRGSEREARTGAASHRHPSPPRSARREERHGSRRSDDRHRSRDSKRDGDRDAHRDGDRHQHKRSRK